MLSHIKIIYHYIYHKHLAKTNQAINYRKNITGNQLVTE